MGNVIGFPSRKDRLVRKIYSRLLEEVELPYRSRIVIGILAFSACLATSAALFSYASDLIERVDRPQDPPVYRTTIYRTK